VQKEIISGILRPTRSVSQPDATAPTNLGHRGTDSTNATLVKGTSSSCEIGTMISRNLVKSKAPSIQPNHAAHQASHWSFTTVVMVHLRIVVASYNLARLCSFRRGMLLAVDSQVIWIITSSDDETTFSTIKL
jgi:hypothetical protein